MLCCIGFEEVCLLWVSPMHALGLWKPVTMHLGRSGSHGICVAGCVSGLMWTYVYCEHVVALYVYVCILESVCLSQTVWLYCVCQILCVHVSVRSELAWGLDVWHMSATPQLPSGKIVTKVLSLGRGVQGGTLALPSKTRKGVGGCERLGPNCLAPPNFTGQQNDRIQRVGLEAGSYGGWA